MDLEKLNTLSALDRRAILGLTEDFSSRFGNQVLQIKLFGSKSMGDDTADSDIDLLIITTHEEWALKHKILTRGARLSLDYGVLFNLYIVGLERWNWMKQSRYPIFRTISKEGIEINRLAGEQVTENDLVEAIKAAIA